MGWIKDFFNRLKNLPFNIRKATWGEIPLTHKHLKIYIRFD